LASLLQKIPTAAIRKNHQPGEFFSGKPSFAFLRIKLYFVTQMKYPQWPQFFTATIYEWKRLLAPEKYKNIITDCLREMVGRKQIELNAYVLMDTHVHFIWQPLQDFTPPQVQTTFTSYTSKRIIKQLSIDNPKILDTLKVNKYDRTFQVWKRRSLSIELFTEKTFLQKLEYIHENPVRAGLVKYPEEYVYSSARFYHDGTDVFKMITHYMGE
jgi:REP element-mobilizing transposase RayT